MNTTNFALTFGNGFVWNGKHHYVNAETRDDSPPDEPTGVREPRQPRPPVAPSGLALAIPEEHSA